jgi:hypothetical protein
MLNALLLLSCELLVIGFMLALVRSNSKMRFLPPLAVSFALNAIVEVLIILSSKEVSLLPSYTSIYTYPVLTLADLLCTLWFVSYFTTDRKALLVTSALFTALWITAKFSIELFFLVDGSGNVTYPLDTTTYAIAALISITLLGRTAAIVLQSFGAVNDATKGITAIVAGYTLYSCASLVLFLFEGMIPKEISAKLWWINNTAYIVKCAMVLWGLKMFTWNNTRALPIPSASIRSELTLLQIGALILFAVKFFWLSQNIENFGMMGIFALIGIIIWCGLRVASALVHIYSVEKALRENIEKLNTALTLYSENIGADMAQQIAIIRAALDGEITSSDNEVREALIAVRSRLNEPINSLIILCLSLLDRNPRA